MTWLRCYLICVSLLGSSLLRGQTPPSSPGKTADEYRRFAFARDGDPTRGRRLFSEDTRTGCAKCHSLDGSSSKAGPDLYAAGDKFGRRELIDAILTPSANIAIGYGTTIVETKTGEEFQGIVKAVTPEALELMNADGKKIRIAAGDVATQRGTTVSLMPEGLQNALSLQEFADLIEFTASLKQPDNAESGNRGTPSNIESIENPVVLTPFISEELRFPHAFVQKPGDVRYGLVDFHQLPGMSNFFLGVHQTGKIWVIEKHQQGDRKTLFGDFGKELFNERGPNGLLGLAFHPKFRENRKYYLKHQVFEDGKIATTLVEKQAAEGFKQDSGLPSRRLLKIVSTTQDHSGGCIQFGPDGYLYLGMGDTGPQQDPQGHGQDFQTFLGKMLRIDVDRRTEDKPYGIPRDNPFVNRKDALPEIWALGFREPWRFSFDSVTGDLWVGDVGQDRVEEVSIVRRGENHGWNVYEGFKPFSQKYRRENEKYTPPVFAYKRKYGNSITGGFVYRGDRKSSFYGVYICGDYTSKRIWGVKQKDRWLETVKQIGTSPQGIASFATDEQGGIYVVGYEGMVYKMDFSGVEFR